KNKNFFQIIIEVISIFLSSTLFSTFIGFLIDKKFKTTPLFILIFLIFGIFLSLYLLYLYNKNL
ncbi:MAG: AtpZ/AtpI family protein, partial [Caldisericia bacterium]|nr:AtpZ/AtpI family protein [Caldisericia bacterium]